MNGFLVLADNQMVPRHLTVEALAGSSVNFGLFRLHSEYSILLPPIDRLKQSDACTPWAFPAVEYKYCEDLEQLYLYYQSTSVGITITLCNHLFFTNHQRYTLISRH
jgi:hypothetical protein